MASADRSAANHLINRISEEPYKYDFFRLMRHLQSAYRDNPRFGNGTRLKHDSIRLRQEVSLKFASSTVTRLDKHENTDKVDIYTLCFGLWGANGPMPHELTQYVIDRIHHDKDTAIADFADIFHHRLLTLFFKAWADAQKAVDYDRPEDAHFPRFLNSFSGLGMPGFANRDSIPDRSKAFYSGHLSSSTQHGSGLQSILEDYFEIKTELETFVGHWMELPKDCCCRLGESESTGLMGQNIIVGEQVWDRQLKFRIVMGPMDQSDYQRMLPGKQAYAMIKDWVSLYTNQVLFWDLQLILKAEGAKPVSLGESGQLGWTTWLMTGSLEEDSKDLILNPEIF